MRKSCFTETQIFKIIKEQEAGLPTFDLYHRHGLGPAAFSKLEAW